MNMNMNIATVKFVFIFNLSYPAVGCIVDITIIINIVYYILRHYIDTHRSMYFVTDIFDRSSRKFNRVSVDRSISCNRHNHYTATTTTTYKYEIGINIYIQCNH